MAMNVQEQQARFLTRRHFLRRCNSGLGLLALSSMLDLPALASDAGALPRANPLAPRPAPRGGKAKRIMYLDMSGDPPPPDLVDSTPKLHAATGTPCANEI